jgi:hypothetical protein
VERIVPRSNSKPKTEGEAMILLADIIQIANPLALWRSAQVITAVISIYLYIQAIIGFTQALHSDRSQGMWQNAIMTSGSKFLAPSFIGMLSVLMWGVTPPPIWG